MCWQKEKVVREYSIYPQRPIVVDQERTKTIGYFGDSFCANSISDKSWCNILAKKLGCGTITHWGVGGTSLWTMLLTFQKLLDQNKLPFYIVIFYTHPDRIYHPNKLLPLWATEEKSETELEKATDLYIKHLDFKEKNAFQYMSAIQWFDQNILSKLESKHKIVQAFSFENPGFDLASGKILAEPMMPTYLKNKENGCKDEDLYNHLTPEQNIKMADKLVNMLT